MIDIRIGIDTGGTFTDFAAVEGGKIHVHKVLSTPTDPAEAVLDGCIEMLGDRSAHRVIHGSTVATNALLERRGARTALITTKGFEDIIEIGRQTRSRIYDIMVDRQAPLVPRSDRHGLRERVGPFGKVELGVDDQEVGSLIEELRGKGIESIAICFLNSYANPQNERRVEEILREVGEWTLSASYRILPEYREFERCSTTVVNAYVSARVADYLERLGVEFGYESLRVMQSNGGFISAGRAADEPIRTILSGPAGGVIGALEVGKHSGFQDIISFDMGGTSTDVCLCRGEINTTTEAEIGGYPIRIPVMDIHTVGAGGGSIAWIDRGGVLRVGPKSAGADPGPICYGVGDNLTVSDAHLYLGRLEEEWFLGGKVSLKEKKVERAIEDLAAKLGKTPREAAMGIIEVANAKMERAIRVISLERGHDPSEFTLVTFGGAGALHACDIAKDLSIRRILIPGDPGALSAIGMVMTDVVIDHSTGVLLDWGKWSDHVSVKVFAELEARVTEEMVQEIGKESRFSLYRSLDMRYVGQSYELNVSEATDPIREFHRLHRFRYGHADPGKPVEVVAARVRALGKTSTFTPPCEKPSGEDPSEARIAEKKVCFREGIRKTPIYRREALRPGNRITGPALIVEFTATSLIPPRFAARVDGYGNLIVEEVS